MSSKGDIMPLHFFQKGNIFTKEIHERIHLVHIWSCDNKSIFRSKDLISRYKSIELHHDEPWSSDTTWNSLRYIIKISNWSVAKYDIGDENESIRTKTEATVKHLQLSFLIEVIMNSDLVLFAFHRNTEN